MAMMGGVSAHTVFLTGMWLMPTAYANHPKNSTTAISEKYVARLGIPGFTESISIVYLFKFRKLINSSFASMIHYAKLAKIC
jgi:hypothetical protein